MPFRASVFAATALLLGGCQTVFDSVGVAVPLSASRARQYDGSYQGYIRPVTSNGPECPREPGERVLMVGDGVLWYAYNPATLFAAPVNSDGEINAASGDATLSGKVVGNHLQATVKSPRCETRINMDFIYNHT